MKIIITGEGSRAPGAPTEKAQRFIAELLLIMSEEGIDIEQQEDMVGLRRIYDCIKEKFEGQMLFFALYLAHCVRAPAKQLDVLLSELQKLDSSCTTAEIVNCISVVANTPCKGVGRNRKVVFISAKRVLTWDAAYIYNTLAPAFANFFTGGSPTEEAMEELAALLQDNEATRRATNNTSFGGYNCWHPLRFFFLVTKTKEPGVKFRAMGSTCDTTKLNSLRKMGLNNVTEINALLPEGTAPLTPLMLDYYICMGLLLGK